MDVVVVAGVAVEVRADEQGTYGHALVELLVVLGGFIGVGPSAVSGLAFVYEVVLALVRI